MLAFWDKPLCFDAASIGSFLGFVTEQKKLAGILKMKRLMKRKIQGLSWLTDTLIYGWKYALIIYIQSNSHIVQ